MHNKSGFTLVELSIVLVIIGLITGGVLVGQDMIEGAKLKAQVKQLEQYDAAIGTFREKYNFLPGDCAQLCDSSGFGLVSFFVSGTASNKNGAVTNPRQNDIIEGGLRDTSGTIEEASAAWPMLGGAGMIEGSYTASQRPNMIYDDEETVSLVSDLEKNVHYILGAASRDWPNPRTSLSPYQAWKIDSTIDDANPSAGKVRLGVLNVTIRSGYYDDADDLRMNGGVAPSSSCVSGSSAQRRTATVYEFDRTDPALFGSCPLLIQAGV